jgi:L-cystine uptake protein TcyP (sodium:dicarboxylate symporter family)
LVIVNLLIFAATIALLVRMRGQPLSRRVLLGLGAGVLYGLALQFVLATDAAVMTATLEWTDVVADGYVALLKMIIMPLVLTTMVAAVLRLENLALLGRVGGLVIGVLVGTTMIAALIGVFVTATAGLTASGLTEGVRELARAEVLVSRQTTVTDLTVPSMLVGFIPANIFADLTGARPTSIIAVVVFGMLTGIATLLVSADQPARGVAIRTFVENAQALIMKLVSMVMALTPYGIFGLMTGVVAGSDGADILKLIGFVGASYCAIGLMFIVHGLILASSGQNLVDYGRRVWPVLAFAFTSRSSAAAIPLNVEAQVKRLGVSPAVANVAASFGATIGQNGCAGIYPAMLAVMIAPTVGIDPLDPFFVATLVGIVTISSFGVAGVGGGATYSALIVLPAMGLPVTLAALLISIEPLIDMARTALNVNGSITAGAVTSRVLDARATTADIEAFGEPL